MCVYAASCWKEWEGIIPFLMIFRGQMTGFVCTRLYTSRRVRTELVDTGTGASVGGALLDRNYKAFTAVLSTLLMPRLILCRLINHFLLIPIRWFTADQSYEQENPPKAQLR